MQQFGLLPPIGTLILIGSRRALVMHFRGHRASIMAMRRATTSFLILHLTLYPFSSSRAADLPGLYFGGSVAQARPETTWTVPPLPITAVQGPYRGVLNETTEGFKVLAGIRPIQFIGAEVAYDDFGNATAVSGPCGLCVNVGPAYDLVRNNSDLVIGAGAQSSIGHFGARAEFERFTAAGAHPALLSLGIIWRL